MLSKDSAKSSTLNVKKLGFDVVKECPLCKGKNGHIEDIHSQVPFCPVCMDKLRGVIGLK